MAFENRSGLWKVINNEKRPNDINAEKILLHLIINMFFFQCQKSYKKSRNAGVWGKKLGKVVGLQEVETGERDFNVKGKVIKFYGNDSFLIFKFGLLLYLKSKGSI